jgi:hypothetical protein
VTEQSGPDRIGPYRLLRQLGSGGMGVVYLARSPGGRLVAIKVIRADLAADEEFRARFSREVTLARQVSGFYTAPVVDADTEAAQPWLATAYVAGPSLADSVTRRGPLPAGSVLALAGGLAEALQSIHAAGLVHRDLKPSNILLASDGPRVIDFGISQALSGTRLTSAGTVVGSPGYMSPEQAKGAPAGPASDVFSLGAVLAFAATGREPFGGGTSEALLYRVVNEAPDLSGVPDEILPLVASCLAKDPERRPVPGRLLTDIQALSPTGFTSWRPAETEDHAALAEPGSGDRQYAGPGWQPTATSLAAPSLIPDERQPRRLAGLRWRAVAVAAGLLAVVGAAAAIALSLLPGAGPSSPPRATVCQGDGTGCTKPGSYGPVNAVVSSDYDGFKVTWTSASVVGTSAGYPTYWTAYLTFTNTGSSAGLFSCAIAASVWMHATGGKGDDGYLKAETTTCAADTSLTASLAPGQSFQFYATFHNVPWPGSQVAIQLQDNTGTIKASSPSVYPFV